VELPSPSNPFIERKIPIPRTLEEERGHVGLPQPWSAAAELNSMRRATAMRSMSNRGISAFAVRAALRSPAVLPVVKETEQWLPSSIPLNRVPTRTTLADPGPPLSTRQAIVSIASLLVNIGLITEPYALSQCGLILGTLVLAFVSTLILFNSYAMNRTLIIVEAMGEKNADLSVFAELAFGERGKKVVTSAFLIDMWAAQLTYYVIIAQCLDNVFDSMQSALVVSGLLTVAMFYVPVKWITRFQQIGGLAILMLLMGLVVSGLSDPQWPDPTYEYAVYPAIPSGSSMMVFAYGNLAVLPALLDRIPVPNRTKSISWGVFVSFLMFAGVSVFSYLSYGPNTLPSILNNVGKDRTGTPLIGIWGSILRIFSCTLFAIKLQLAFPLLATPSAQSICDLISVQRGNFIVNIAFVAVTVCSAYILMNHLALLGTFVGSLITVPLVMLFPTALYWRLSRQIPLWEKLFMVGEFILAIYVAAANLRPGVSFVVSYTLSFSHI